MTSPFRSAWPRTAALALLSLTAASCRGRSTTGAAEVRRSALDFATGTLQGSIRWNGAVVDPNTVGSPNHTLDASEANVARFGTLNGDFSALLSAGAHTLTVVYPQGTFPPACSGNELGELAVDVAAGATTNADFDLTSTAGRVTGVANIDGVPSPVELRRQIGCDTSIVTDASGAFSALLPVGSETVEMWDSSGRFDGTFTFTVVAGATTDLGTLAGSTSAGGGYTGDVTFNGSPLPAGTSGLTVSGPRPSNGSLVWTAPVGATGHFDTRVPPGTYAVELHTFADDFALGFANVSFSPGATTVFDYEMNVSAGLLVGTVTQGGLPIAATLDFGNGHATVLSASGTFSVFVSAGTYRIAVVSGETQATLPVTITAGHTTDVGSFDIDNWDPLTGLGGSVSGAVTWNGAAVPVPDALELNVFARGDNGRHWEAALDATGQFTVANAEPGDYAVSIGTGSIATSTGGLTPIGQPLATQGVTVVAGAATAVDFDLSAAAGRVVGTGTVNGAPNPAGTILMATTGFEIDTAILIGPDGRFSALLTPGNYVLDVRVDQGTDLSAAIGQVTFNVVAGQTTDVDASPGPQACTTGSSCASGLCVDGMCCDIACGGGDPNDCQACSIAAGGTIDGTCTPLAAARTCYTASDFCASVEQTLSCSTAQLACPASTPWPAGACTTVASGSTTRVNLLGGAGVLGGATLTFNSTVTTGGEVAAIGPPAGGALTCPLPAGFDVVRNASDGAGQLWNIETAPTWTPPMPVEVCVHYDPSLLSPTFNQCNLRLYHGSDSTSCSPGGAGWININEGGVTAVCPSSGIRCSTSTPCTANTICGTVTDHLSPFAVAAPVPGTTPSIVVPGDLTVDASGPAGVAVSFPVTASDPQDGPLAPTCVPASGATFPIGMTPVICTATDQSGLVATGSFTVTVRNGGGAGPVIGNVPDTIVAYATTTAGATVTYTNPTATGAVGGVTCLPASGTTFVPGTTTVTCTATDGFGVTATASFIVWVQYQAPTDATFFLPPIDGHGGAFKQGSTVPVKFKLTGASAGIKNLVARLLVAKMVNGVAGPYVPAESTPPCEANTFRYDPSAGLYIFNLATRKLAAGTWSLRADLGDLVTHTVNVSVR